MEIKIFKDSHLSFFLLSFQSSEVRIILVCLIPVCGTTSEPPFSKMSDALGPHFDYVITL